MDEEQQEKWEQLAALAEELRHFSGGRVEAGELFERAMAIGNVSGRTSDPAQIAVRKAQKIREAGGQGEAKEPTNAQAKKIDEIFGVDPTKQTKDPEAIPFLAPFLGQEPNGTASYHEPLIIDDDQAIGWARYMAAHRVIPDERMRDFVHVMLQVRPRNLWIPAAESLAAFALRGDEESKKTLVELCKKYPYDPSKKVRAKPLQKTKEGEAQGGARTGAAGCPDVQDRAGENKKEQKDIDTERATHLRRHVRYAAACWLAGGGDPGVLPEPMRKIAQIPLPTDVTEASIEVLCLAARLRSPSDRSLYLPTVITYMKDAKLDPVFEEAVRLLYKVLVEADGDPSVEEARQAVRKVLMEPGWLGERQIATADLLWSWLQSIDVLRIRENNLPTALSEQYPVLAPLLRFRFMPESVAHPSREVAPRLKDIFLRERFAARTRFERALCVAEAAALLEYPEFSSVNWSALISASVGKGLGVPLFKGDAGSVGLTQIICWLASLHGSVPDSRTEPRPDSLASLHSDVQRTWFSKSDAADYIPLQVIRDRPAEERAIIALAEARHEKAANQVAVQAERLLRQRHDEPAEQIRFLWRLLEVDPLNKVFEGLQGDLRGENDTTLARLVASLAQSEQKTASGPNAPGETMGNTPTDSKKTLTGCYCDQNKCLVRMDEFLPKYEALIQTAINHLPGDDETCTRVKQYLDSARASINLLRTQFQSSEGNKPTTVCRAFETALVGDSEGKGLAAWFDWVDKGFVTAQEERSLQNTEEREKGNPDSTPSGQLSVQRDKRTKDGKDLVALATRFRETVDAYANADGARVSELLDDAMASYGQLMARLKAAPWPEREGLCCALDEVGGFLVSERKLFETRRAFAAKIEALISERDVMSLTNEINAAMEQGRDLPPVLLEAAHGLLLQTEGEQNEKALKQIEEFYWTRYGSETDQGRSLLVSQRLSALAERRDTERIIKFIREEKRYIPYLGPSLLETAHKALLTTGGQVNEEAAEELRKLAAGSKARLPHIVKHHMEERQIDKVLREFDKLHRPLDDLGDDALFRLNEFLLERLHICKAIRLKRDLRTKNKSEQAKQRPKTDMKAQPRSWFAYLAPLMIGVPAGTLLVLDVGTSWSEVALSGREWAFWGTIAMSLLLAFVTLVVGVVRRTAGDARKPGFGGWLTWMGGLMKRSLPVFGGAWALAFVCSFLVLVSLSGTSATVVQTVVLNSSSKIPLPLVKQTLLWSGLSLFLGIFLGLIAQGRGPYERGKRTE